MALNWFTENSSVVAEMAARVKEGLDPAALAYVRHEKQTQEAKQRREARIAERRRRDYPVDMEIIEEAEPQPEDDEEYEEYEEEAEDAEPGSLESELRSSEPTRRKARGATLQNTTKECPNFEHVALCQEFSDDCPISDKQVATYYRLAGGDVRKTRTQIVEEALENSTEAGQGMCSVFGELTNPGGKGTMLKVVPFEEQVIQTEPGTYLDKLRNYALRHPEAAMFKRSVHDIHSKMSAVCHLCNNTPLDDVIQLSQEQDFVRHYFTPFANLPGLLIAHSVGAGKTISAIAMATSSWVFQGYDVMWLVMRHSAYQDAATDGVRKFGNQLIAALARGSSAVADRFKGMSSKEAVDVMQRSEIKEYSFEMLMRFLEGKSHTTAHAKRLSSGRIPDKLVLVIDEAHLFVNRLGPAEFNRFRDLFSRSRAQSPDPIRVVFLTATPLANSPLTLFKLLALMGADEQFAAQNNGKGRLPVTEAELAKWIDPATGTLTTEYKTKLERAMKGLVSFVDVSHDVTRFPQISKDTWVKVPVSRRQVQSITKCLKEYDVNSDKPFTCTDFENFAEYKKELLYDSAQPLTQTEKRILAAVMDIVSPKCKYLIKKINALDLHDSRLVKKDDLIRKGYSDSQLYAHKHVIYCNTARTAKMVWSFLIHEGLNPVQQRDGSCKYGPHSIAFLSAEATIFGKKMDNLKAPPLPRGKKIYPGLIGQSDSYIQSVVNAYNMGGEYGEYVRVLVIDHTLSHGMNLYDSKYLHILEPTDTSDLILKIAAADPTRLRMPKELLTYLRRGGDFNPDDYATQRRFDQTATQVIGRVTRMCGMCSFPYNGSEGWQVELFRYYAVLRNSKTSTTVFEAIYKRFDAPEIPIKGMLLNMQLQQLLLNCTIEKDFALAKPGGTPITEELPSRKTKVYVNDYKDLQVPQQ